jgi:hypothetical protein
VRAIADVAQFVVHDINNLFAVIGSGLRLLKCRSDAAYRKASIGKMQEAIMRGALLAWRRLDASRPCPKSTGGAAAGSGLARLRIPRRQASDGCADIVAPSNTWRPGQRCSS